MSELISDSSMGIWLPNRENDGLAIEDCTMTWVGVPRICNVAVPIVEGEENERDCSQIDMYFTRRSSIASYYPRFLNEAPCASCVPNAVQRTTNARPSRIHSRIDEEVTFLLFPTAEPLLMLVQDSS